MGNNNHSREVDYAESHVFRTELKVKMGCPTHAIKRGTAHSCRQEYTQSGSLLGEGNRGPSYSVFL